MLDDSSKFKKSADGLSCYTDMDMDQWLSVTKGTIYPKMLNTPA